MRRRSPLPAALLAPLLAACAGIYGEPAGRAGSGAAPPDARVHAVRPGDTLSGIARRFRVDMRALAALNGLSPPYLLRAGRTLRLPGPDRAAAAGARRAAPAPSPASPAAAPPPPRPRARPAPPGTTAAPPARRAALPPAGRPPEEAAEPPPPVEEVAGPPISAEQAAEPPPRAAGRFLWPARGRTVSAFGPGPGGSRNDGLNIAAPQGTAVLAAGNGVVVHAGAGPPGFGRVLAIRHAGGWTTVYAHLDRLLARRGDVVSRGQAVATVGDSGGAARPQLHFETRRDGRPVDPLTVLE